MWPLLAATPPSLSLTSVRKHLGFPQQAAGAVNFLSWGHFALLWPLPHSVCSFHHYTSVAVLRNGYRFISLPYDFPFLYFREYII